MNQASLGASQALEDVARRLAARQAESLQRYSSLLSRFGSATLSTRELGENLYKLAVEESARALGDAVDFGVGYWRGVFGAVAPTPEQPQSRSRARRARAPAGEARRKTAARPRPRR